MAFITWFLLPQRHGLLLPCICPALTTDCKYQHRDKKPLMTPHQEKVLDILLIVKQDLIAVDRDQL